LAVAFFWINEWQGNKRIEVASADTVLKQLLPDGSIVWLNKHSIVRYKKGFANHRSIELVKGEGFFEVKKDVAHPFIVKSGELNTTVKGTSFSVKMLPTSGNVKVSVATGRVAISKVRDTLCILFPNQRIRYNSATDILFQDSVMTAEAKGWIEGDVLLERASLAELADWLTINYNIVVENKALKDKGQYFVHFSSTISLDEAITILNLIVQQQHIQFFLQSHKVTIRHNMK